MITAPDQASAGKTDDERVARAETMMRGGRRASRSSSRATGRAPLRRARRDRLRPLGTRHELGAGARPAVIGRSDRHVHPDDADRLIAGYTIVNDMGTLNLTIRADSGPMSVDFADKFQPGYKPAGPFVVPASSSTSSGYGSR